MIKKTLSPTFSPSSPSSVQGAPVPRQGALEGVRVPVEGEVVVWRSPSGLGPLPGIVTEVGADEAHILFYGHCDPVVFPSSLYGQLEAGPPDLALPFYMNQSVELVIESGPRRVVVAGAVSGIDATSVYISWGTPLWTTESFPFDRVPANIRKVR